MLHQIRRLFQATKGKRRFFGIYREEIFKMGLVNYYFARMNIVIPYDGKKIDFLKEMLCEGTNKKIKNYVWTFLNISEFSEQDDTYIRGNLAKYTENYDEEVIENGKSVLKKINNKVQGKSDFILECKTGLIAFTVVTNSISPKQFGDMFSELCRENVDVPIMPVDIALITDKKQVFERISSWDKVEKVTVTLHPSNPNSSKIWADVDKKMKKLNIGSYKSIYRSESEDGLRVEDEIRSEIAMATDGYGVADLSGEKDKRKVQATTKKSSIIEAFPKNNEDNQTSDEWYAGIIKKFKEIQEKIHRGSDDDE